MIPAIDIGLCSECGGCIEIAPEIFRFNDNGGYFEVIERDQYSTVDVDEAIKNCPEDCIYWEE